MYRLESYGDQKVGPGSYWNLSTGERVQLTREGRLPGNATDTYTHLPPLVMLLLAPFLGLVYALFLPFIGLALLITVIARKLFGETLEGLWKVAAFGWRPSEAYLLGRKKARKTKPEPKEPQTEDEEPSS